MTQTSTTSLLPFVLLSTFKISALEVGGAGPPCVAHVISFWILNLSNMSCISFYSYVTLLYIFCLHIFILLLGILSRRKLVLNNSNRLLIYAGTGDKVPFNFLTTLASTLDWLCLSGFALPCWLKLCVGSECT